uniref:Uncharacterized protein n=1 Tax=Anguilla anguilla TaxID=7936 RepID=A0A0E9SKV7_ANGAN
MESQRECLPSGLGWHYNQKNSSVTSECI